MGTRRVPRARRVAALIVAFCSSGWGQSRVPPAWVTAKPDRSTQTQTTAQERGVNPCATPDPGFGTYGGWHRDVKMGQYIRPVRGGLRKDASFDVMFHFHGHEPARKEWVKAMTGAVLVSVDLGIGSGPYESTFQDPAVFVDYLHSVEVAMAKATGNPHAHAKNVGLSAWSAGYGAVQRILSQPAGKKANVVILLDGLHAGYFEGHVDPRPLESVTAFAQNAAQGHGLFFISHSSIVPPGYASTTETAHYLVWQVGGKPKAYFSKRARVMGLQLISYYDKAGFHERGYRGNDKMDHCAHLGLYAEILKLQVAPLWKSPKGRAS